MAMIAHDPEAAKRVGVKQSVGKDFVAADKAQGKAAQKRKPLYSESSRAKMK